jgi:hypothetical protein
MDQMSDDQMLEYLDFIRQRIIAAMTSAVREQGFDEVVLVAQEAFADVLPQLPGLIELRVPEVEARIYSAAELRQLFAEFAADLLSMQTDNLIRAVRPRCLEQGG